MTRWDPPATLHQIDLSRSSHFDSRSARPRAAYAGGDIPPRRSSARRDPTNHGTRKGCGPMIKVDRIAHVVIKVRNLENSLRLLHPRPGW
ncbi:hypothetical protein HBB16_11765 [Pseudonocardia sp. MCCB 268]|nr:hypothetical protein [Pseudonocardia cytotoxica]